MPKRSNDPAALAPAQIQAYLDRIEYRGPIDVSGETLRGLHLAHLLAVPFENLDIGTDRYIQLDLNSLFEKVVIRRRGGYCYELNGMFAGLLRGLGFEVELLSAGVADGKGAFSPPFDHLTLLVHLEQPWLADVGFGDSFLEPVPLAEDNAGVEDSTGRFRVRSVESDRILERNRGDGWQPQYRFDLTPHQLNDFAERNDFQQTSPDSHFTQARICSLARPGGRISLSNLRLITTQGITRDERDLSGEDEFRSILESDFGIVIDGVLPHANLSATSGA